MENQEQEQVERLFSKVMDEIDCWNGLENEVLKLFCLFSKCATTKHDGQELVNINYVREKIFCVMGKHPIILSAPAKKMYCEAVLEKERKMNSNRPIWFDARVQPPRKDIPIMVISEFRAIPTVVLWVEEGTYGKPGFFESNEEYEIGEESILFWMVVPECVVNSSYGLKRLPLERAPAKVKQNLEDLERVEILGNPVALN